MRGPTNHRDYTGVANCQVISPQANCHPRHECRVACLVHSRGGMLDPRGTWSLLGSDLRFPSAFSLLLVLITV